MGMKMAEIAIGSFLKRIRERLEHATSLAKAAEACAVAGIPKKGVEMVRHLDPPIKDATTLLDLIKRCTIS